jgi:hypothetical protein
MFDISFYKDLVIPTYKLTREAVTIGGTIYQGAKAKALEEKIKEANKYMCKAEDGDSSSYQKACDCYQEGDFDEAINYAKIAIDKGNTARSQMFEDGFFANENTTQKYIAQSKSEAMKKRINGG